MKHPVGIGLWSVSLAAGGFPVVITAHTAHTAWQAASARLGWAGFDECAFLLLSDRAPEPAKARRSRKSGRLVAERGARL